MLRGFYTAASGMLAAQYRQDMLTHNLANSETPGFKADQGVTRSFPQMLMQANQAQLVQNQQPIGGLSTAVYLQEQITDLRQGDIKQTGNSTDLALMQQGAAENEAVLFSVQTENGVRYTRNGNLQADEQGRLATGSGYLVQGIDGNPIQVNNEQFTVGTNGVVTVDGQAIGTIQVVHSENTNALEKDGDGLYRDEENVLQSAHGNNDVTFAIQQYALENSNVNVAQTMNEMLQSYRLFEANQKVLQAYDQSLEKAVNEVGRIT